MKYQNAFDILPEELVLEIQKYTQGEIIYIPAARNTRAKWGSKSGYRDELFHRNKEIMAKFKEGMEVIDIAEHFYLSEDSIRKIVYKNK